MKIIRSDTLNIKANNLQRNALQSTLGVYQSYVKDLMLLINSQWHNLSQFEGNEIVKQLENLIHPTHHRPQVKYQYFSNKYYKFPSYLRRVAIMDAAGQVSSFRTRFNDWLDGNRRKQESRPPKLTCKTNTYPSLYRGQCIKYSQDYKAASIKVYWNNDWIWMIFKITGKTRYLGEGKELSPLLSKTGKKWKLSIPTRLAKKLKNKTEFQGKVLAVDVGMNTDATCSVVDKHGTVLARRFFKRSDKDREYQIMQRIRATAKKQTRHGNKLPIGFCKNDYRRLKQLSNNESHQISRQIINLAIEFNCDAIILEDLKGWKPKGGRKRSNLKAKFHRWFHRMLHERICSKARERGIHAIDIFARGTSSYAFDGSGKVKRDKDNYANAKFPSGKNYNADLNATYNIAARGILKLYYPSLLKQQWSRGKPNACPTTGNPLVLSSLRLINNRKAG